MKRNNLLFKILALIGVCIFQYPIVSASTQTLTIKRSYETTDFSVSSIDAPWGGTYSSLNWKGLEIEESEGMPMKLVDYLTLEVPLKSKSFSVLLDNVILDKTLALSDSIMIGQAPVTSRDSHERSLANSYVSYPISEIPIIEIGDECIIAQSNKYLTLKVSPYTVSKGNKINLFKEISFTLTFETEDEVILKQSGLNQDFQTTVPLLGSTPSINTFDNIDNYVIIAPSRFCNNLQRLRNWKALKGYYVEIVALESIVSDSKYSFGKVDQAETVREFLRDRVKSFGPFFCLLVGDENSGMPIRKVVTSGSFSSISPDNNDKLCPTDLYFSDLTEEWPLIKEPSSQEWTCLISDIYKPGRAYSPDIIVGRLLCSTVSQIENYIDKLILYESNPGLGDNEYLNNMNLFESEQMPFVGKAASEEWSEILNTTYHPFNAEGPFSVGAFAIQKMRNAGINSWYGHGQPYGIAIATWQRYITSLDSMVGSNTASDGKGDISSTVVEEIGNGLDNLDNMTKPSIVYSMSCDLAPFDWLHGGDYHYNPTLCMAEVFTTGKNFGGPAFLGNTRSGYFDYMSENYYRATLSSLLEVSFLNQLTAHPKIGIAETLSKIYYSGGIKTYLSSTHNLIGEPEFEVWLQKPIPHSFSSCHEQLETIFSSNGQDWKVVVTNGKNVYSVYRNDAGTTSSFNHSLLQKDHVVSAWHRSYLPFIHYYGISNRLENVSKQIDVRSASISCYGSAELPAPPLSVGNKGILEINALDNIVIGSSFNIEEGGKVNLQCAGNVTLGGTKVDDNSILEVKASSLELGKGFNVKKGGSFKAQLNK